MCKQTKKLRACKITDNRNEMQLMRVKAKFRKEALWEGESGKARSRDLSFM